MTPTDDLTPLLKKLRLSGTLHTLELRTRRAGFEALKTLEDFEFSFNPKIPKAKIIDLATCQFVTRKESVLLAVLYLTANRLFAELRAARAARSYDRKLGASPIRRY